MFTLLSVPFRPNFSLLSSQRCLLSSQRRPFHPVPMQFLLLRRHPTRKMRALSNILPPNLPPVTDGHSPPTSPQLHKRNPLIGVATAAAAAKAVCADALSVLDAADGALAAKAVADCMLAILTAKVGVEAAAVKACADVLAVLDVADGVLARKVVVGALAVKTAACDGGAVAIVAIALAVSITLAVALGVAAVTNKC